MPIVSALLVVALGVALSLQLFASTSIDTRLAANQALQMQQQWSLQAALGVAQARLAANLRSAGSDALDQPWASVVVDASWSRFLGIGDAGPLDPVRISQRIADEQGKLNLHNLLSTSPQPGAAAFEEPQVLAAYRHLLTSLSLDPALAQAVADRMLMQAQAQAHGIACCAPGQMPIDNFESLQTVPGYTPRVLDRLRPYVAVLPTTTSVNVNTATALVLAAAIPGLSPAQAEAILCSRRQSHFDSLSDFSTRLNAIGFPGQIGHTMLGVRSSYFTVFTQVRDGRADFGYLSLLHRIATVTIVERSRRIV